ncbi:MAG: anti-phage ZorAB system protein ZorA [Oscillatoriaceae cyanobacterium]
MNQAFVFAIIVVAIAALAVEIYSIIWYCKLGDRGCKPAAKGIDYLTKNQRGANRIALNNEMKEWLLRHFDGQMDGNFFIPKKDGGKFVMVAAPSVLSKPVPRGPVYFAPTLLTALGVLGTFAGIYFGLQNINLEGIENTDSLLKASTELLGGMKLAFSTSLWGLGSSSLFMLVLAAGGGVRQWRRDDLRQNLNKIAVLDTPVRILSRMSPNSSQGYGGSLTAEAIGQAVATSMQGVLPAELRQAVVNLTQLTPERIGIATAQSLSPELQSLKGELSTLRELQQQQGSTIEHLVQQLRQELIEPVVERLDASAQLTKEASEAVKELKTSLGGITESLAEAISTIQRFQGETLNELQQFASNLQSILGEFRHDTQGVLQQVATEIQAAVKESITGMEAQRQAFEASAQQAADTFNGIQENLQQALVTQAKLQKRMLEQVAEQTNAILEQANQAFISQSQTLVTLGSEASGVMNTAADNLNGTLTNIDGMLQQTRQTVQEELDKFRVTYQESLNQFFEQQNNLLSGTLDQQRAGLESVINQLKTVFVEDSKQMGEEIKGSMNYISETTKTVSQLAATTGLTSGERLQQLQEIIRELGSEAKQITDSYQNMANQFDQSLKDGQQQLASYLNEAHELYTNRLRDIDSALAQYIVQLKETSHGIIGVSHYLVASAQGLKNGNGNGNGN